MKMDSEISYLMLTLIRCIPIIVNWQMTTGFILPQEQNKIMWEKRAALGRDGAFK
jgi:hypothetical protein